MTPEAEAKAFSLPPAGLYVHVPFCLTKCDYCDFYSTTDVALIPQFLLSLEEEMLLYVGTFSRFDTVYFGGGTPSLLSAGQISLILQRLRSNFYIAADAEITVEMNPADWDDDDLRALRDSGVNRISLGIQSPVDNELVLLGRRHDAKGARSVIKQAVRAGFPNVGADLLYGLPGQSLAEWQQALATAADWGLQHLSCYQLEVKSPTPLGHRYAQGEWAALTEAAERDFFLLTSEVLEAAGYVHYEVSNFARGQGFFSRHNQKYWNHTPYLGLGPAAHSFCGKQRWHNCPSLPDYGMALEGGRSPVGKRESLSEEQLGDEALLLGLRTQEGVDIRRLPALYRQNLLEGKASLIRELQRTRLIVMQDDRMRPTREGLAVAEGIALWLSDG